MTDVRALIRPPTLGAVIVNYNYQEYVGLAVRSVLEQTDPFDAIVVVDDGSTDESLKALSAFDVRVVSQANAGQLRACITGLSELDTDYVYFLDADDVAHPDLVEKVRSACMSRPVKVQFQLEGIDERGGRSGSRFPTYPVAYEDADVMRDIGVVGFYVCPPTSGNVYLRQALLRIELSRLNPRDFIDGPATLALPWLGQITCLPLPLAMYRVHSRNHSQWSKPSDAVIKHEIKWFNDRWKETCELVGIKDPPFEGKPLYVLEREMMLTAFTSGSTPAGSAMWRYCNQLNKSRIPVIQKVLLAVWAAAFIVPSKSWRQRLVQYRRSVANRNAILQKMLRFVLGVPRRLSKRS